MDQTVNTYTGYSSSSDHTNFRTLYYPIRVQETDFQLWNKRGKEA